MMVQPAAPTSCYACITTPIVNSSPYQLISGACSAIGALAQRIMNCVTSIFTAIVNFVKSCFSGATAGRIPPGAAGSIILPATHNPTMVGTPPVAPTGINVTYEARSFLEPLVGEIRDIIGDRKLLSILANDEKGNDFLAHLLVYTLVMNVDSIESRPLPFMVTRGMGATATTFISSILRLRTAFYALDRAPELPILQTPRTDDDNSSTQTNDEEVEVQLRAGETLRRFFYDRHVINGLQDDMVMDSSNQGIDNSVFPENIGSPASDLYAELKTLAGRFADPIANPTFFAAANEYRMMFMRSFSLH